jgi:hypothetical protein
MSEHACAVTEHPVLCIHFGTRTGLEEFACVGTGSVSLGQVVRLGLHKILLRTILHNLLIHGPTPRD